MKTYDERTKDIRVKLASAKQRRGAVISAVALCCCMAVIAGLLLIPKNLPAKQDNPKVVLQAQGYGPLIQQLTALLEEHKSDYMEMPEVDGELGIPEDIPIATPDSAPIDKENGSYEEITDNQVQGVTEADLIKRSDKHIYYLRGNSLTVYSIEKEESKALGSYEIGSELGEGYRVYSHETQMYLSRDCRTVTVLTSCYQKEEQQLYLYLLSLDVTDPEQIRVSGSCFINGNHKTSRLMDGQFYVVTDLYLGNNQIDFEDQSTFLPGYGTPEDMTYLPMEDIYLPDEPGVAMYTVVTKLDGQTLEVTDSVALLSYTGQIYMSLNNIYLTRGYADETLDGNEYTARSMTEITRLSVGSLKNEGSFVINGSVKDQYSLDEYDGILRVVTAISENTRVEVSDELTTSVTLVDSAVNASLYCVDLSNHSIRAKVERFAPEGETVQSVRFDGAAAYVCTSVVLSDPVFFFDLSDLDNIRHKDTGTIDGYSMSLVDFTEGFLMGIGYGDSFDTLKIEMYREGATTVESHCVYEREPCGFSSDYKSYYIDRENQLIGLGIWPYEQYRDSRYILLHFNGYEFEQLLEVPNPGDLSTARAVYIDGYLYIFGDNFRVEQVD